MDLSALHGIAAGTTTKLFSTPAHVGSTMCHRVAAGVRNVELSTARLQRHPETDNTCLVHTNFFSVALCLSASLGLPTELCDGVLTALELSPLSASSIPPIPSSFPPLISHWRVNRGRETTPEVNLHFFVQHVCVHFSCPPAPPRPVCLSFCLTSFSLYFLPCFSVNPPPPLFVLTY